MTGRENEILVLFNHTMNPVQQGQAVIPEGTSTIVRTVFIGDLAADTEYQIKFGNDLTIVETSNDQKMIYLKNLNVPVYPGMILEVNRQE